MQMLGPRDHQLLMILSHQWDAKQGSGLPTRREGPHRHPCRSSLWGDLFELVSLVLAGLSPDPRDVESGQVAFCHTRLPSPVARDQAFLPLAESGFLTWNRSEGLLSRRPPWEAVHQLCGLCRQRQQPQNVTVHRVVVGNFTERKRRQKYWSATGPFFSFSC